MPGPEEASLPDYADQRADHPYMRASVSNAGQKKLAPFPC